MASADARAKPRAAQALVAAMTPTVQRGGFAFSPYARG
jgi:hypothetical protein